MPLRKLQLELIKMFLAERSKNLVMGTGSDELSKATFPEKSKKTTAFTHFPIFHSCQSCANVEIGAFKRGKLLGDIRRPILKTQFLRNEPIFRHRVDITKPK